VVHLNQILETYACDPDGGLQLFKKMVRDNRMVPDTITYHALIGNFIANDRLTEAEDIMSQISAEGFVSCDKTRKILNPTTEERICMANRKLKLLLSSKGIVGARVFFDELVARGQADVSTYNYMLQWSPDIDATVNFFIDMGKAGLSPDLTTFNTIIALYVHFGRNDYIPEIMQTMEVANIAKDKATWRAERGLFWLPHADWDASGDEELMTIMNPRMNAGEGSSQIH